METNTPEPLYTCSLSEREALTSAQLLKLLADPMRLRILSMLRKYDGKATVEDIVLAIGTVTQQAISHHLGLMRNARLIEAQRHGFYIRYSINEQMLGEVYGRVFDLLPRKTTHRRKSA